MVYATDHEHARRIDRKLVALSQETDLLIHDAQYTEAEYTGLAGPSRCGWGHSCWDEAAQTAVMSGATRLALFHHDPMRSDDGVAAIEEEARGLFPGSFAAREGRRVAL